MRHDFMSLKWQVAISVSLILICGFGIITSLGHSNLQQTYINERGRVYEDRQRSVNTALKSIQLQLTRIASHLQGLASQNTDSDIVKSKLSQVIHTNWDQLSFDWGVDSLMLYGPEGEVWQAMGKPIIQNLVSQQWLDDAHRSEAPLDKVLCRRSCWQFVAVPVLVNANQNGVMILVSSLEDAVIEFQNSTAADVGILVPQNNQTIKSNSEQRRLKAWQRDIVALTNAPKNLFALQSIAEQIPLEFLKSQRLQTSIGKRQLEVSLIPLAGLDASHGASLIILEDVASDLAGLDRALSLFLLTAFGILVLAEVALIWLLSSPMAQLKQVAEILPKLALGNKDRNLVELGTPVGARRLRNETHELQDAARVLASKLNDLDTQVKIRTRGLKVRSRELLAEKNFVTTLLNSIHAVILTQDKQGNIQLINQEGKNLLGIDEGSLAELNYLNYLQLDDHRRIHQAMQDIYHHKITQFRHECDVVCNQGNLLHMEWHHSLIAGDNNSSAKILSVGLDLTARKAAENDLAWMADHDSLTELFNRRRFQKEFEHILKRSRRNQRPGALIFFDIDQFKLINDTSGHPAGDRLLCEVANRLSNGLRDVDVVARLGGDEFAVLVEEMSFEDTITLTQKICKLIGDIEVDLDESSHKITVSLGIALFPEHGDTVDELLTNVDLAMYKAKAKANGRSNWHVYSADTLDKYEMRNRMDWKAKIQKSLELNRFILYYQPILDIKANTISHYEALVRMQDEDGGIIAPANFIHVAEKTGQILQIDRFVVKQAMRDLSKFTQQGHDISISVNVSAKALSNSEFTSNLAKTAKEIDIDKSKLIFELTETSAVDDIETTAEIIAISRELGYKFSIDDFGIGYSSWFYLRKLPVDFVKIDGSFVRNLGSKKEDGLFVKAINDVAQGLGKKTIAEFVETKESLQQLKELGIDFAQGYYIGKPQADILINSLNGSDSKSALPLEKLKLV